jgi:C-terminal processing protease CtpA/Prc
VPRWQEWLQAKPEEREPFLAEGKARIEAIVAELEQRQAQGLVIDLRGNGGGTDALGIHLAERLLGRPFVYFQLSAQDDEGGWRLPGGITYGQGDHARYSGPLALLVDGRSFSTTDNFARCLDDLHPECTIVGRPSGGGTGAPRALVTATHSKAVVGACTMRVLGPKGRLTEGRGTVPDVAVRWTRADVLAGRDPDLEAALAAVGK